MNPTGKFKLIATVLMIVSAGAAADSLKEAFRDPPAESRPGCYWYWINDNISKEGITKDLEAMARVGIGRAYLGHIFNYDNPDESPVGNVKFMTEAWWDAVQWAVKEADRCGVEIGFFNAPGWSQSGGPWVQPSQSMRYLAASESPVTGGRKIEQMLPVPDIHTFPEKGGSKPVRMGPDFTPKDFQDVRVIAYPKPKAADLDMKQLKTSSARIQDLELLFDGSEKTSVTFDDTPGVIRISRDGTEAVQSIRLTPVGGKYTLTCVVEISEDGTDFQPWARHVEQRGHQGPRREDPLLIPIPATEARHFRITLSTAGGGKLMLAELQLSTRAVLANHVRKQLGETSPSTNPKWDAYTWAKQPKPAKGNIRPDQVIDLTGKMDENGVLRWDAPAGEWIVMRSGMIPVGTYCAPSSPESGGLEVDKMSTGHIRSHFDAMVGEFLRRTPPEDRKALKYVIADSYETGPQNWTDGFVEMFSERFGYSPVPFLPCIHGHVVDSPEVSNRFLWDWRRLIAESVARNYVGGLRDVCDENGLTLWLENYGHWGFPSEFLLYGSMSDQVGGEFWESATIYGNIECRAAASCSHIYGRSDVYVEAFTSNRNFKQSPADLKSINDWVFAAGANHLILHVYIHQPSEQKPGLIQWFGTAFNRHNTWFGQSNAFIDYLRRSSVLLKAGRPVIDVAYYIGQNAPVMTGPLDPALPDGYDYDHINADALIHRATVVDGRIRIENGPSYSVLVLPQQTTMTPEVAKAIRKLVSEGATILGPKPKTSPSLADYPGCDRDIASITDPMWRRAADTASEFISFGKGKVFSGTSLENVLGQIQLKPDITVRGGGMLLCAAAGAGKIGRDNRGGIVFKHRTTGEREIYFLSNTMNQSADFMASFRVAGRSPSFWNANTGEITEVVAFSQEDGRTHIPMRLEPAESIYVVFASPIEATAGGSALANHREFKPIARLNGPWNVRFEGAGAPAATTFETLADWTRHSDPSIRNFSGSAIYETRFTLAADESPSPQPTRLHLGKVGVICTVTVNDQEVGTVWTTPWAIDISKQLKAGGNTLKIRVTNTWNNRLVTDAKKPEGSRVSHVSRAYRFKPGDPLLPSGLIGPVVIQQPK